jgi:hypothetical protein
MKDRASEIEDFIARQDGEILSVLRSAGRSRQVNDFPVLEFYSNLSNGEYPFIKSYSEVPLNHVEFLKDFELLIKETLYTREVFEEHTFDVQIEAGYYSLGKGYIAEISVGYHTLDSYATDIQTLLKKLSKRENTALVANVTLYCPSSSSTLKDIELETQLFELVKKHKLPKNTTTPCIGMICMEDGEFYIKDFYIKKDYTIKDGDLHYGEGFMDFHDKLLDRFRSDSKGLVLFHGTPGTGKTFYIRSLIKDLLQMGRYIIYLPPGMVDSMVDPGMLNFLSSAVMEKAEEGKSCILLLEDAEPLLASRKTENRSAGITNLLNVTDGLLNDMLSIQVIATFNTELSNIDEALLRPERLIARKEFKKLKKEDAILLAKSLGVDRNVEDDMTLAEIYSQSKSNEVLVHEYNNKRRSIGFK